MSGNVMLEMAKAIMKTGRYCNNKQISDIHKSIFGTVPTQKKISSIKHNLWRRDMYETRSKKINGIRCIRVISIDGVKAEGVSVAAEKLNPDLYKPDATDRLLNSVFR